MTIENITKAVSKIAEYLNLPLDEISFTLIEAYKPKGGNTIIIEVEFINESKIDSLEVRTSDFENYEVWGYDFEIIEKVESEGDKMDFTKKRLF